MVNLSTLIWSHPLQIEENDGVLCLWAGFCSRFYCMVWPYLPWNVPLYLHHWIPKFCLWNFPLISHYTYKYIYIYIILLLLKTIFLSVMFHSIFLVFLIPIVVGFILETLVSIPMIVIPFSHYRCEYTDYLFPLSKNHSILVVGMAHDIPIWYSH